MKGFTREDFAMLHPGGVPTSRVAPRPGPRGLNEGLPRVREDATPGTLLEILNKRLGMTTIVDAEGCSGACSRTEISSGSSSRAAPTSASPWPA